MPVNNPPVDTLKLDQAAVDGLSGTANSLAYYTAVIQRHLHSGARWFEAAASPSGDETHKADRIGSGGDSFAAGLSAGTYSEFIYAASVQKEAGIIMIQTGRAPAGSKVWARCMCPGQNTATFDFYIGVHEYEG